MDNSTACAKSKRRKAVCDRGTHSGFPHLRRLPIPINGWPTAIAVLKRGTPRRVAPPPRPEPTAVRHKAARQNQQPRQKALPAGLRPDRRTKRGTCRAWLIDGRGKAWSKRPDRQAGRPLSPARVRAMPERFVVIERPKNRFIRKGVGQHRALNGLQQCAEAAKRAFEGQGTAEGRAVRKNGSTALW